MTVTRVATQASDNGSEFCAAACHQAPNEPKAIRDAKRL